MNHRGSFLRKYFFSYEKYILVVVGDAVLSGKVKLLTVDAENSLLG